MSFTKNGITAAVDEASLVEAAAIIEHESETRQEPEEAINETKLRWKIDLYIMPLLCSIFFLGQMGTANIGNAATAGMNQELRLTPATFSNIITLFSIGFIIGSLPGTLLLRMLGPPYQFSGAMLFWGLLTVGCAYAKHYGSVLAYRFFTGTAESFIQGGIFYLSFWYRYEELATRAALTGVVNSLAGAVNGVISYGIENALDGRNHWRPWRWLFLIEGSVTAGWALVVGLFLPSTPYEVKRGFSEAEKRVLVQRASQFHNNPDIGIRPKLIFRVLRDPQAWLLALIQSGLCICAASTGNFLPSIMEGLGYEGARAQLMTAVVYLVQAVAFFVVARLSDMTQLRGPWIIGGCLVTAVGYIVLLTSSSLPGRLVATCLVSGGSLSPTIPGFVWVTHSNPGYTYRATALALMNIVVRVAGIGANYAFRDPPLYHYGLRVCLIVVLVTALLTVALSIYFRWMNANKERNLGTEAAERLRARGIDEIGNKHPDFFFGY